MIRSLRRALLGCVLLLAGAELPAQQIAYTSDLAPALKMQGNYAAGSTYNKNDVVASGGVLYYALQATTGNAPTNAAYWSVLSGASAGSPVPVIKASCSSSLALSFAGTGDVAYDVTQTSACSYAVSAPANSSLKQSLMLYVTTGGFAATFPASSSGLVWSGGSAPTNPNDAAFLAVKFDFKGTAPIFGGYSY